jgi:hypothetical protein
VPGAQKTRFRDCAAIISSAQAQLATAVRERSKRCLVTTPNLGPALDAFTAGAYENWFSWKHSITPSML